MTAKFPNESADYRRAREALLAAEIDLRRHTEKVAALRRTLPLGGVVNEDYVFEEGDDARAVRLSELFGDKSTLVLYCYMYGPKMAQPCPMCTSMLDGLEGQVDHIRRRAAFAVVARSPIARILDFTRSRGWKHHRLLSSANNTFHRDYLGESENGAQMPMMNVFVRREGKTHHFWGSEMLYEKCEPGEDSRHVDIFWPLWNVLDLTPEGRGEDFYPKLRY